MTDLPSTAALVKGGAAGVAALTVIAAVLAITASGAPRRPATGDAA